MRFLNPKPGYDLTYDDVFMVPNRSSVTSRLDVDLATEVSVTGGIDDVNGDFLNGPVLGVGTLVLNGRVLGEDGDAFFTLKVAGVHDSFTGAFLRLVSREGTSLPEHGVNQGCLAMVNVGDNR